MSEGLLKVNILSLTVAGFLMLVTGLLLYLFKDTVSSNIRFFLPIPPIGVAAYIFVFNLFNFYNGKLPGGWGDTLRELTYSAVISGVVYCAFIVANLLVTYFLSILL